MRELPLAETDTRTVDLLTDVATRYHVLGESQIVIARDLALDPSTVSRYLKRAREEGIVHVEIRRPRREHVEVGRDLAERFGLARVVVATAVPGEVDAVAAVAAGFIDGLLRTGMRLGVSWGRTLAGVIRHLRPGAVSRLSIAQLAGGVDDPLLGIQGHELVGELAELYPESRVQYLHAPAIVASVATRRALLSDPSINLALHAARHSELALVGIGQMDLGATLPRGGHVSPADWRLLEESGAVGNVNTRFFDAEGRPVARLERRTIAVEWSDLRSIPTVVGIATGIHKVEAIRGALKTRCIDMFVTDEPTATRLLVDG
jgi:DNA-binding transcriptional regulator LsrR (DeoR family)